MNQARITQLKELISQSLDVFNVYGKTPDTAKNMLLGFEMCLEDCDINQITEGFKKWMKKQPIMPTPSDILKICQQENKRQNDYNRIDELSRRMQISHQPTKKQNQVQWHQMSVDDFNNQKTKLIPSLKTHASKLIESKGVGEAKRYFNNYLHSHIGYDISWDEVKP